MQGVYEGITTTVGFPCCFFTPDPWPAACSTVCLLSLIVLLQYVPGDLLVHDTWLLPRLIRLSVLPSFCQSEDADVLFSLLLCAITCTSFFHLSPLLLFSLPHSFSLSLHLSCRLFIRCVNNCLPTVVIAPPCQLEVWSKWQCAQFSLAYIVQFLVFHVPLAKKKREKKSPLLLQLCFISGINFWVH